MSGFTPCINEPVFGFSAFEAMLLYKVISPMVPAFVPTFCAGAVPPDWVLAETHP